MEFISVFAVVLNDANIGILIKLLDTLWDKF
jgi:hypothetical protein